MPIVSIHMLEFEQLRTGARILQLPWVNLFHHEMSSEMTCLMALTVINDQRDL